MELVKRREDRTSRGASPRRPPPRVVHPEPAVQLGRVTGRAGALWRVAVGARERLLPLDPAVDPALLEEALASGARVVIDGAGAPCVAGVLLSARPLTIDRAGDVAASVRRLAVRVADEALLATPRAFVRVAGEEVELFGNRVLARAREVAKILGRLIALN